MAMMTRTGVRASSGACASARGRASASASTTRTTAAAPTTREIPVLGLEPGERRCWRGDTALGPCVFVTRGRWLVGLYTPDDPRGEAVVRSAASVTLATSRAPRDAGGETVDAAVQQIDAYAGGGRDAFRLPLAFEAGTPFQRAVWTALAAIPWGATSTYGALAAQLGRPTAARAVGAANGANPLSIVLPCHRVVGASGALTGYAGGLAMKQRLLEIECSAGGATARSSAIAPRRSVPS